MAAATIPSSALATPTTFATATSFPLVTGFTSLAPLPTAWSPPASCATPTFHNWAGNCSANVCTFNPQEYTLDYGGVNWPYHTAFDQKTSTDCVPPQWQSYNFFAYYPASGCPTGYTTAASQSYVWKDGFSVAFCCPSSYSVSPRVDAGTTYGGRCQAYQTISSGETYWDVAVGPNTQTVRLADEATTKTTTLLYQTESAIKLATAMQYQVVTVQHPLIQILIPATATPSATSSSSGSSAGGFSLFGLSQLYSIVCIVGGVVVFLFLVGCCYGCCCRRKSPKRASYITTPQVQSAVCDHGRWSMCSFRRATDTTCCACRDSRPASDSLDVESRIAMYCHACRTYWDDCEMSQRPMAWKTVIDLVVEEQIALVERSACAHGAGGLVCSTHPRGSKKCCACVDTRRTIISREDRVKTYCAKCAEYYTELEMAECPKEWRLSELQCRHTRSKACVRSSEWEATCCVCTDTRSGIMPRADRTAMYCPPCSSHWNSTPSTAIPPEWGIKCSHGELYLSCITHSSLGQCCACTDLRSDSLPKETRLQSSYCPPCSSHWLATPDYACPRTWNLRCPHNRAWADGSRANSPCCCACKDHRTMRLPKAQRIATYCWSCKALWGATPDHACPPGWQLGCKHGGMANFCTLPKYAAGPPTCCACLDNRTKNMPKSTRTRTYCPTCQSTWNAWPDGQCPPEWGLLAPRVDCKHNLALECLGSLPGQAWCCACKDGRKFLGLGERVGGYCIPCGGYWKGMEGDEEKWPVSWRVRVGDLVERVEDERGRLKGWGGGYVTEDGEEREGMEDEGPRYGAPRFGRERVEGGGKGRGGNGEGPKMKSPEADWGDLKDARLTPRPVVTANYEGYEEKWPQRDGPRFSVPAVVAVPKLRGTAPPTPTQASRVGQEKGVSAVASDPPVSPTDKQRRKEQEGLCVGRQPRFLVPPGT